MTLIKINTLKIENDGQTLLTAKNLSVSDGEIIGIVGNNGSGKTSLLKAIVQSRTKTTHQITYDIEAEDIAYLEQEESSFTNDYQETPTVLKRWHQSALYNELSGGEKIKWRLQTILNLKKKVVLLDEPTNHLDEQSVAELIQHLKHYQGALVIVSHDRYFLDQLATQIWSLENGTITRYEGNYSKFKEIRRHKRITQQHAYDKQQKEIKTLEKDIQMLKGHAKSAHAQSTKKEGFKEYYRVAAKRMDKQRKSREKKLMQELNEKKVNKVKTDFSPQLDFNTNQKKAGPVYIVENLSKEFSSKMLFKHVNFTINHGEKIAISGSNGSGKTTLLKILLNQTEAYAGRVWRTKAEVAYLSQDVFDLPLMETASFYLEQALINERTLVTTMWVQLGFSQSQLKQVIGDFSMGERIKLKLLKAVVEKVSVLVLDEPTNHLDLATREELESVLIEFPGTIVFVSHDRYFREKIATRCLIIQNKQVNDHLTQMLPRKDKTKKNLEKLIFKRDRLLSELSSTLPNSTQYKELEKEFQTVLKEINELK